MGRQRSTKAQTFIPLKPRVFEALVVLSSGPLHGYGLKLAIQARTAGRIDLGPGTLYRTIRALEADGLIEEVEPPVDSRSDDDRRRAYRLTALGRAVLRAETERLEALVAEVRKAPQP